MPKFKYTLYEDSPKKRHSIAGFYELQLALACQSLIEKSKMHKYPLRVRDEELKRVV